MSLEQRVEDLLRDFPAWDLLQADLTPSMWAAYRDAMPALALGLRLGLDERVTQLVKTLSGLPAAERLAHAQREADWVPKAGRRVVVELLLRAVEGGRVRFASAAAFTYAPEAITGPGDPARRPKGVTAQKTHDWFRSCAHMADLAVKRLLHDTSGLELRDSTSQAAQDQQLRAFLQEAAAHVLGRGELDGGGARPVPLSPSRRRRHAASRTSGARRA